MKLLLANEQATINLGQRIAEHCPNHAFTIHLEGDLGAGKTTLTRGFLTALGHKGHVKSPTYTLVEPYQLNDRSVFHFDLYRLADPEELDYLGLDDYLTDSAICLIEWPSQAGNMLPKPDLLVKLTYIDKAREAKLTALTQTGKTALSAIENASKN